MAEGGREGGREISEGRETPSSSSSSSHPPRVAFLSSSASSVLPSDGRGRAANKGVNSAVLVTGRGSLPFVSKSLLGTVGSAAKNGRADRQTDRTLHAPLDIVNPSVAPRLSARPPAGWPPLFLVAAPSQGRFQLPTYHTKIFPSYVASLCVGDWRCA